MVTPVTTPAHATVVHRPAEFASQIEVESITAKSRCRQGWLLNELHIYDEEAIANPMEAHTQCFRTRDR